VGETRYRGPDTSDRCEDETWTEYWDRKMDERHGEDCHCHLHEMRKILREHPKNCPCLVCGANRYVKDMIR
jgi:hypothetical protein